MGLLHELADNSNKNSLANKLRRKRFAFFAELLDALPRPLSILDVGGTTAYWKQMGYGDQQTKITLLNLCAEETGDPNFISLAGDARDLSQFSDDEFDVVYSNSVIEHVGDLAAQQKMAREVARVAKRYIVQTPNYYFPMEPHFLVPGFQFMPLWMQIALIQRFKLGWTQREPDVERAEQLAKSVRLLKPKEFSGLFPEADIYIERWAAFPKSYIAYYGWRDRS